VQFILGAFVNWLEMAVGFIISIRLSIHISWFVFERFLVKFCIGNFYENQLMVRGSNPSGGEIFHTCPDRPWGPPRLLYNGYRVLPGGKVLPGRDADPSPPSSAVGHERVELYLYSPYGPDGLYRASVPVQGYTLPFTRNYTPFCNHDLLPIELSTV